MRRNWRHRNPAPDTAISSIFVPPLWLLCAGAVEQKKLHMLAHIKTNNWAGEKLLKTPDFLHHLMREAV